MKPEEPSRSLDGSSSAPQPKVRVLHVITGLDLGGAESMLTSIVESGPSNIEQSIISLIPGGHFATRIRSSGIRVTELALSHPSRVATEVLKIARIIRAEQPDIVQGWMYHGNIAGLLGLVLAGRRSQTRILWGIRRGDPLSEQWRSRAVIAAGAVLARYADAMVANSEAGLTNHARIGYRAPRMLVIHNGIDTDKFRPDHRAREEVRASLGWHANEFVVAHVGRVHPVKNHASFVTALRGLPGVKGLAIGAGTLGLPDLPNLRRLGQRLDVARLLAASDVIVSTSLTEGFSNSVSEGMAAGLVPIVTDVGDSAAIVGDTGRIVAPRCDEALRRAVAGLLAAPRSSVAQLGARARERIVTRFSLQRAVDDFARLYRDLAPLEANPAPLVP